MRCSFCGLARQYVGPMVASPTANICAGCVEVMATKFKVGRVLSNLMCLFCRKAASPEVPVAVAERGATICAECVRLCVDALAAKARPV